MRWLTWKLTRWLTWKYLLKTCLPFSGELSKWSSDQERDRSWFEGRLWWPQQSDWNPPTSVEDDQCHTTKVYSWILNISHGICDCVYAFVMVWLCIVYLWLCIWYFCLSCIWNFTYDADHRYAQCPFSSICWKSIWEARSLYRKVGWIDDHKVIFCCWNFPMFSTFPP